MEITYFGREHIDAAAAIARGELDAERRFLPCLPLADIPDLDGLAGNALGFAALDGGKLIGYLCGFEVGNIFGSGITGIWSPLHASGVIRDDGIDRGMVFARLYQAAAEKWVGIGARHHSVTLFAHDSERIGVLFDFGFGKRCVDAMTEIGNGRGSDTTYPQVCGSGVLRELFGDETCAVSALRQGLAEHLVKSPCFMNPMPEEWYDVSKRGGSRYFVYEECGVAKAFLEVGGEGENYLSAAEGGANIRGAYCFPELRGGGVMRSFIGYVFRALRAEGIIRVGVDYESINPCARGFWPKYFAPYTFGLVRRID